MLPVKYGMTLRAKADRSTRVSGTQGYKFPRRLARVNEQDNVMEWKKSGC